MSGWLALLLQASALAFAASFIVSTVATALVPVLQNSGAPAARRADGAFVLGVLPMITGVGLLSALTLPSVLHATGLRLDHCNLHDHHAHLCALHAEPASPLLLLAGVAVGLFTAARALQLASRQLRASWAVSRLERLGSRAEGPFPTTRVPGSPWVCLATGIWRPRVVLSASLEQVLGAEGLDAALAHEHAHLRRRDPALRVALAWASLWALPAAAATLETAFRDAAEEASDADAAQLHGPLTLAQALVAMARLPRPSLPAVSFGLGDTSLERRVRRLVAGTPTSAESWSVASVTGLIGAGLVIALGSAESLHHAVETLLHAWN